MELGAIPATQWLRLFNHRDGTIMPQMKATFRRFASRPDCWVTTHRMKTKLIRRPFCACLSSHLILRQELSNLLQQNVANSATHCGTRSTVFGVRSGLGPVHADHIENDNERARNHRHQHEGQEHWEEIGVREVFVHLLCRAWDDAEGS